MALNLSPLVFSRIATYLTVRDVANFAAVSRRTSELTRETRYTHQVTWGMVRKHLWVRDFFTNVHYCPSEDKEEGLWQPNWRNVRKFQVRYTEDIPFGDSPASVGLRVADRPRFPPLMDDLSLGVRSRRIEFNLQGLTLPLLKSLTLAGEGDWDLGDVSLPALEVLDVYYATDLHAINFLKFPSLRSIRVGEYGFDLDLRGLVRLEELSMRADRLPGKPRGYDRKVVFDDHPKFWKLELSKDYSKGVDLSYLPGLRVLALGSRRMPQVELGGLEHLEVLDVGVYAYPLAPLPSLRRLRAWLYDLPIDFGWFPKLEEAELASQAPHSHPALKSLTYKLAGKRWSFSQGPTFPAVERLKVGTWTDPSCNLSRFCNLVRLSIAFCNVQIDFSSAPHLRDLVIGGDLAISMDFTGAKLRTVYLETHVQQNFTPLAKYLKDLEVVTSSEEPAPLDVSSLGRLRRVRADTTELTLGRHPHLRELTLWNSAWKEADVEGFDLRASTRLESVYPRELIPKLRLSKRSIVYPY